MATRKQKQPDRAPDGKFLPDAERKPGKRAARDVATKRDPAGRPKGTPKPQ